MEQFWKQLEAFASYAFPKAHAACYALIGYWTGYLKANYPEAFMAALMTSDFDDIDRLAIEITECKHVGIDVLAPDVNESFLEFAVVPGKKQIRFGLRAIKNVGANAVDEIIRVREQIGGFQKLEDFFGNVSPRVVNRKSLESLIKAGAFDGFGDRSQLLGNLDHLLGYANKLQKDAVSGQIDLLGSLDVAEHTQPQLTLSDAVEKFSPHDQLLWERELLGLYLSQHPLQHFETILSEQTVALNTLTPDHDGKATTVGGAISDVREITTKNGQKMAFVKIGDQFGDLEIILFPSIYQQTTGIWERDRVIIVKGKISAKDREGNLSGDIKVLAEDAREITPEQASAYQPTGKKPKTTRPNKKATANVSTAKPTASIPSRVYVRLQTGADQQALLSLKQTIDLHPGETEVVLVIGDQKQIIRLPNRIAHETGLPELQTSIGADFVKLQ
jgi:DNA polymerase-3 subunit alpha